jgi:hypothetical protein
MHKGTNLAGMDPRTGKLTRLFHPRQDSWEEHFAWQGPLLIGKTPLGRATLLVLNINDPVRLQHREILQQGGLLP